MSVLVRERFSGTNPVVRPQLYEATEAAGITITTFEELIYYFQPLELVNVTDPYWGELSSFRRDVLKFIASLGVTEKKSTRYDLQKGRESLQYNLA